jgi:hypothetical protein
MLEVLDPLDTEVVEVTFTARDIYLVLEALYFDTSNDPLVVLDLVKYIEGVLLDSGMPASRIEFDSEYLNNHKENEQYKRIVLSE